MKLMTATGLNSKAPLFPEPQTEEIGDYMNATLPVAHIIGIDTSHAPVRVVVTAFEKEKGWFNVPYPVDQAVFDSLSGFVAFWAQEDWSKIDRIAVPEDANDPLGIRAWLWAKHLHLEAYPWTSYRAHLSDTEFRHIELSEPYLRAYALAVYASYSTRVPAIARDVWAKVFEAQDLLKEIQHSVHRLVAAMPEQRGYQWTPADVPF